jgi:hypothetical protein
MAAAEGVELPGHGYDLGLMDQQAGVDLVGLGRVCGAVAGIARLAHVD